MVKAKLKNFLTSAIRALQKEGRIPRLSHFSFKIDQPPREDWGDFSTTIALQLASQARKPPSEIASLIQKELQKTTGFPLFVERIHVTENGFLNFFLSPSWLVGELASIIRKKERYCTTNIGRGKKIQVEFLSANPTGPLHMGNGRGAFFGDTLARVLLKTGHKVSREYYVNLARSNTQIQTLGKSILRSIYGSEAPGSFEGEKLYQGKYIEDLAKRIRAMKILSEGKYPFDRRTIGKIGETAGEIILKEQIRPLVKKFGIRFNRWFYERDLYKRSAVDHMIDALSKRGLIYESDGALWLKTSLYGDAKDRVMRRSDGTYTYIAPDIVYHLNKFKRGFDRVIDVWGADHHGYVDRLKAAMAIYGKEEKLTILITQLVRLIEKGKEVKMSKRTGDFITLKDLIDELGLDVSRFFFLMHDISTHMDFDLDLARQQSRKNPVFYVQYAYARIASVLRKVKEISRDKEMERERGGDKKIGAEELRLIKQLLLWPDLFEEISRSFEIHRIPVYALRLADTFHNFYEKCRVIEDEEVNAFRLRLVQATQVVLHDVLSTMGISAPEKM